MFAKVLADAAVFVGQGVGCGLETKIVELLAPGGRLHFTQPLGQLVLEAVVCC